MALQTAEDVLAKMTYVLANPVAAGLVRRGGAWPGLWSAPARIGAGPRQVTRPARYFREAGSTPATADLELVCPAGLGSVETVRQRLGAALAAAEDQAAQALRKAGRTFLGVRRLLTQRPFARPVAYEPRGGLNPRLASRDKWKRLEAILRLKTFLVEYREAWRAFAQGVRATVFPAGTYWMRVTFGVACVGAG